jgi:hypothetical protein
MGIVVTQEEGGRMIEMTWKRLRSSDIVDWLFGLLFLAVGIGGSVLVYNAFDDETKPFGPVSFVNPAAVEVLTENPLGDTGYPPAIYEDGQLEASLIRSIDCAAKSCPEGGFPILATVVWQEVDKNGTATEFQFAQFSQELVLAEGSDYNRFTLNTEIIPVVIAVPPEVKAYLTMEDREASAWKLVGTVTPMVSDGVTAPWETNVFHIFSAVRETE